MIHIFQESGEYLDLFEKSLKNPVSDQIHNHIESFPPPPVNPPEDKLKRNTEMKSLFSFFFAKMGIYFAFKSNKNINLFYTLLELH